MCSDTEKFILTEHPAITGLADMERQALAKDLRNINDPQRHLKRTESDTKILALYDKVIELDNSLNSLQQAINNMSKELGNKEPDLNEFRYHLENYFFRMIGLYDRSILLAGFWIGMDEKCLSDIKTKQNVISYIRDKKLIKVLEKLKQLDRLVKPYRKYRNEIAHVSQLSSLGLGFFSAAIKFKDQLPGYDIIELLKEHFQKHVHEYKLLMNQLQESCYELITLLSIDIDVLKFINITQKPEF